MSGICFFGGVGEENLLLNTTHTQVETEKIVKMFITVEAG